MDMPAGNLYRALMQQNHFSAREAPPGTCASRSLTISESARARLSLGSAVACPHGRVGLSRKPRWRPDLLISFPCVERRRGEGGSVWSRAAVGMPSWASAPPRFPPWLTRLWLNARRVAAGSSNVHACEGMLVTQTGVPRPFWGPGASRLSRRWKATLEGAVCCLCAHGQGYRHGDKSTPYVPGMLLGLMARSHRWNVTFNVSWKMPSS